MCNYVVHYINNNIGSDDYANLYTQSRIEKKLIGAKQYKFKNCSDFQLKTITNVTKHNNGNNIIQSLRFYDHDARRWHRLPYLFRYKFPIIFPKSPFNLLIGRLIK